MSLPREAWAQTELVGWKRALLTIGLSVLILLWNVISGLRGWNQTKLFIVDVFGGYATLTLLEFVFYLAYLRAKRSLLTFQQTIAQEVKKSVIDRQEAETEKRRRLPHLSPERVERIRKLLETAPPLEDNIQVWAVAGYPTAYALAQELKSAIEAVQDWKVDFRFTEELVEGVKVYFTESDTSEYKSLVFQLLTEAGLYFSTEELGVEKDDAIIIVGSHVLMADE
jgi:hypothetical protein